MTDQTQNTPAPADVDEDDHICCGICEECDEDSCDLQICHACESEPVCACADCGRSCEICGRRFCAPCFSNYAFPDTEDHPRTAEYDFLCHDCFDAQRARPRKT